jgi:hypothetical protein
VSLRVVALVALALGSASFSGSALASPVCDPDGDDSSDDTPALTDARVILPCAIADTPNGCADAAIYVMTTGGVLLCEIDIPALVEGTGLPEVEQTPAAPTATSFATALVVGMPPAEPGLAPVIVRDLPVRAACDHGEARDGFTRRHIPPS